MALVRVDLNVVSLTGATVPVPQVLHSLIVYRSSRFASNLSHNSSWAGATSNLNLPVAASGDSTLRLPVNASLSGNLNLNSTTQA